MTYFYGHKTGKYKSFSNFYLSPFEDDEGNKYSCSEQYFMAKKAKKFKDDVTYKKIMKETDPSKIKKLGREVKNFDQKKWEKWRYNIMFNACMYKFEQNEKLMKLLCSTEGVIAEASPRDTTWGIGIGVKKAEEGEKWRGKNLLGKILMEIRDSC